MDLYGQLLHNVKQFIPQVNMAPGPARNARGPRLLTMSYGLIQLVTVRTKTKWPVYLLFHTDFVCLSFYF